MKHIFLIALTAGALLCGAMHGTETEELTKQEALGQLEKAKTGLAQDYQVLLDKIQEAADKSEIERLYQEARNLTDHAVDMIDNLSSKLIKDKDVLQKHNELIEYITELNNNTVSPALLKRDKELEQETKTKKEQKKVSPHAIDNLSLSLKTFSQRTPKETL